MIKTSNANMKLIHFYLRHARCNSFYLNSNPTLTDIMIYLNPCPVESTNWRELIWKFLARRNFLLRVAKNQFIWIFRKHEPDDHRYDIPIEIRDYSLRTTLTFCLFEKECAINKVKKVILSIFRTSSGSMDLFFEKLNYCSKK